MNGLLLINKPTGFTSFDVIARLRKMTGVKKIGHTGTLDPMATGVLPVLFGQATRLADLLPESDKRYRARVKLGVTTDTFDITGTVLSSCKAAVTKDDVQKALQAFKGEIPQLPPMYSAVKKNGVRLYDLARKGEIVEREPRQVTVHELSLLSYDPHACEFELDVLCSKGTYIRSLCDDLGKALGCGAVLTALCRTAACGFALDDCVTLEECESRGAAAYLIKPDRALAGYQAVTATSAQSVRFLNGGALSLSRLSLPEICTPLLRVYSDSGRLIGLGEVNEPDELLKVKVLFPEDRPGSFTN